MGPTRNALMGAIGLLAVCAALPAAATVGGPSEIEVVGYDAADHKLYILHHRHDASDSPPALQYFLLASDDPYRAIPVKSWYEGAEPHEFDWDAFEAKLTKLRARLSPLEAAPLVGMELVQKIVRVEVCYEQIPEFGDCQITDVEIRAAGRTARLQTRGFGRGEVLGIWKVPGGDHMLTIFRHIGHVDEGGYHKDELVFFEAKAP